MSKRLHLLSATLGVILNLGLMLLPFLVLGVPQLVLSDSRLISFLLIISFWVMLAAGDSERIVIQGQQTQARWLPYLLSFAMLSVFLTSLTERAINGATPVTILAIIGGITMSVGVLLRRLAVHALGSHFLDELAIVPGQALVTTGIYNRLRHPSEAGNLCIAFGSPLLLGSLIGFLVAICVLLPVALIRIQLEDRLLMQHYPDKFTAYSQNVPALFSFKLFAFRAKNLP